MLASPQTIHFRRQTRWNDGRWETALIRNVLIFFSQQWQPGVSDGSCLFQHFYEHSHSNHGLCDIAVIGPDIILGPLLIFVQSCRINLLIIVLYIILVFPWCWWEAIRRKSHLSGS